MPDLGKTEFKNPVLTNFAVVFYTSKVKNTVLQKEPGTLQYSSLKGSPDANFINDWDGEEIPSGRDGKPEAGVLMNLNFSKALVSYS